jgi:AraC family transcriptional regulator
MRNLLLVVPLLLVAAVVYAFFNLGVFKKVEIEQGKYNEMVLLYKDHVGPYHNIGDVIKEIENWALEHKVECQKTFGQFLDDPRVVEHERLRSRGGCVLSRFPHTYSPDYKLLTVPPKNYVIAYFEGSPWIGPYKVYGKVHRFAAAKGQSLSGPVFEIYELMNGNRMKTTYLFSE